MKEFSLFNYKVIAVAFVLFIIGCAAKVENAIDKTEKQTDQASVNNTAIEKPVKTAIAVDVLYMLLTAEIAGQREQYDVALDGYLQAAKRVNDPQIAERAAKIALYLKDYNKTDEAVSLWLAHDSANLTARKIAVLTSLRKGQKAEAAEHLNYLLRFDPAGFEESLLELVRILGQEGKIGVVNDVLEEMSGQHPDQAVVFYVQAYLALQQKQYAAGLSKVDLALQLQPDWAKALMLQAQLTLLTDDLEKAKEMLVNAVSKDPKNTQLSKMLAQVLIKSEEYQEAAEVYQQLIEVNPEDEESLFSLALVHLQLKQEKQAETLFNQLVDQPRWQAQVSFYMGRIEAERDHVEKALVWFDKVTSGPLVLEAGVSAFSLLLKKKRFADAETRLLRLRSRFPGQELRLLLLEAELYNKQKQYQLAFDVLTNALLKKPEQKEILYTRALIAERLDRLDILESDLKFILEKHPDDASALNALGYTLVDRTDRIEEAEKYLSKAILLQPDEPVIMDSFGWLQFKMGKLPQALFYLQQAYGLEKEGEIAAHLIEVLWASGKKKEAQELLEEALENSPEDEYLLEVKQRIEGL